MGRLEAGGRNSLHAQPINGHSSLLSGTLTGDVVFLLTLPSPGTLKSSVGYVAEGLALFLVTSVSLHKLKTKPAPAQINKVFTSRGVIASVRTQEKKLMLCFTILIFGKKSQRKKHFFTAKEGCNSSLDFSPVRKELRARVTGSNRSGSLCFT